MTVTTVPPLDVLAGPQLREAFYKLLNIDAYPEFLPRAREIAEGMLAEARRFEQEHHDDPHFWHLRTFPYTPEALEIRLSEIYDDLAAQSIIPYNPKDDDTFRSRDDVVERIRQFAPFNQLDGTWIRNIAQGGPLDVVRSLLFSIWMDEAGDGRPEWNHCNLYTTLMRSVAVYPPPVETEEYANDVDFLDSAFVQPVLMLVLSQFTDDYLPEIVGYTINIEWQVLSLWPSVKLLEYYNIDPHFYTLHIGIDNAVEGHGARAKAAIHDYLDGIRSQQGEDAMQEVWARLWNGFIAADTLGTLSDDLRRKLRDKPTIEDQVIAMVESKAQFASVNHGNVPPLSYTPSGEGSHTITKPFNEWFDDPPGLLGALVQSGYLKPGDPEGSPFFQKLTFEGPMFRVFTPEEARLMREYTRSLVPPPQPTAASPASTDGDAPAPPPQADESVAAAMVAVITKVLPYATEVALHDDHFLVGPDPQEPGKTVTRSVLWWIQKNDPALLLQALSHPDSHMIALGDPSKSPFFTFWIASGQGPMGAVFDVPSGVEGYDTRRDVVQQWITAGCPLAPEEAPSGAATANSGDAVADIIRSRYQAASQQPQHDNYALLGPDGPATATVRWWFENGQSPTQIMSALTDPGNNPRYITPGDEQSYFLTQVIGPGGLMDGVFTPDEVATWSTWVQDNCPTPARTRAPRIWLHTPASVRRLYPYAKPAGPGAIH